MPEVTVTGFYDSPMSIETKATIRPGTADEYRERLRRTLALVEDAGMHIMAENVEPPMVQQYLATLVNEITGGVSHFDQAYQYDPDRGPRF